MGIAKGYAALIVYKYVQVFATKYPNRIQPLMTQRYLQVLKKLVYLVYQKFNNEV